ncbi:MAG: hypothetical protein ABI878_04525 [Acidobacteriota bacterium]
MKTVACGIGFVVVCCLMFLPCFAQGVEERLSDISSGFSFQPPSGWTSDRAEHGFSFVNRDKTILLAVRPHRYNTFEAAVKDTKLDEGTTIVMAPQDLKNGGKFVRLAKQTAGRVAVVDIFVLFSPSGGGVTIIGLSDEKNAIESVNAAGAIAKSIVFTKPQFPSAISSGWESALSGKHLFYLYSGNGYFEEKHIYLCATGVFLQRTGQGGFSSGDVDGPSFSARGGRRGSWSVNGNALVLRFQDASVGQFTLTKRQASNEVGLNGKRYFIQAQNACQ